MTLRNSTSVALAFLFGSLVGIVCTFLVGSPKRTTHESVTADDDCQSLYYDTNLGGEGQGIPLIKTCDKNIKEFSVKPEAKFLDKDFYSKAVELLPTVCVDIVVQRKLDNKVLLLFRRDKPVAGVWWWVGGRAFKGESFFQTAVRKTAAETGNHSPDIPFHSLPIKHTLTYLKMHLATTQPSDISSNTLLIMQDHHVKIAVENYDPDPPSYTF